MIMTATRVLMTAMMTAVETSKSLFEELKGWVTGDACIVTIPLNPVPASRPKVSKWGTYYTRSYATWKRQVKFHLPNHDAMWPDPRQELIVFSEFVVKKARTSKLLFPRGDVDNFAKAAYDAITKSGSFWYDDDQLTLSVEHKRFAQEDEQPHTELTIICP